MRYYYDYADCASRPAEHVWALSAKTISSASPRVHDADDKLRSERRAPPQRLSKEKEFVKDGGNNQRSESRVPRKCAARPCETITHGKSNDAAPSNDTQHSCEQYPKNGNNPSSAARGLLYGVRTKRRPINRDETSSRYPILHSYESDT